MIHCDTMIIKFHGPKPPTSKDINQLYNLIILDRMFFFNRETGALGGCCPVVAENADSAQVLKNSWKLWGVVRGI